MVKSNLTSNTGCDEDPSEFFTMTEEAKLMAPIAASPDPHMTPFLSSFSKTPAAAYSITPNTGISFTPIKPPAMEPKKKRNVRAVLFPSDETPTPAKPSKSKPRERSTFLDTPKQVT